MKSITGKSMLLLVGMGYGDRLTIKSSWVLELKNKAKGLIVDLTC
jgi:hypothetical protein